MNQKKLIALLMATSMLTPQGVFVSASDIAIVDQDGLTEGAVTEYDTVITTADEITDITLEDAVPEGTVTEETAPDEADQEAAIPAENNEDIPVDESFNIVSEGEAEIPEESFIISGESTEEDPLINDGISEVEEASIEAFDEIIVEDGEKVSALSATDITSAFKDPDFASVVRYNLSISDDVPIYAEDCAKVTHLDISGRSITGLKDLSGIEYFTNLESIYCHHTSLPVLDFSSCTKLKKIFCDYNYEATTLNLSGCSNLVSVICVRNENVLTAINLDGCTSLEELFCNDGNNISSLDLSSCPNLKELECSENSLTYLDVSSCPNLTLLSCTGNNLSSLDLSNCNNITSLGCNDNSLGYLDVSNMRNLESLCCNNTNLTSLDVSKNPNLKLLRCSDNNLSSLNVTNCPNLETLTCYRNKLTTLNVKGLTKLTYLTCSSNNLVSLDLSSCTGLYNMDCSDNCFTSKNKVPIPAGETWSDRSTAAHCLYYGKQKVAQITQASQTITTSASSYTKTYGNAAFGLGASAKTPLTYSSSNTAVAAVASNGTVTIKGAGTATITIKAAATDNYKAAVKTVSITVKPASSKISKIAPTSKGLKITWGRVPSAGGYEIYRRKNSGSYSKIKTISGNGTVSFTDTGANTNGAMYTYIIKTYKGNIHGAASTAKAYYRLASPTISSAINSAAKKIAVRYSRNAKATGYQIEWSTNSSFSSYKFKTIGKNTILSYTIPGLARGKYYYVRVRSYRKTSNKTYCSAWSSAKKIEVVK